MKRILSILVTTLFISLTAKAQLNPDSTKTDPSLSGQYQLLLSKSKTQDGYKVVNPNRLFQFWKSVRDTLAITKSRLANAQKDIGGYQTQIKELKEKVNGSQASLATSNARINEINFLGISFTKSNYNMIVWGLILILALTLIIVIIRSAKNIHEAKYRSTLYEEISQEYQNYKTKANEKEKKLARELQDERNKLEELKNR